MVPTGQPSARDRRTIVARVSSSIAMSSSPLPARWRSSPIVRHKTPADPTADDASKGLSRTSAHRQHPYKGVPRHVGRVIRDGFFTHRRRHCGESLPHSRSRGPAQHRRALPPHPPEPEAALPFPAIPAARRRARITAPRSTPVLTACLLAAGPGAIPMTPVARPADHHLCATPPTHEQTPRDTQPASRKRGGPERSNTR